MTFSDAGYETVMLNLTYETCNEVARFQNNTHPNSGTRALR